MAVSLRAVGTYTRATANLTPGIPAGAVTGDMMLCFYGTKPYSDAPTINQAWNTYGSATDGTVAAGVDVGSMQVRVFWKKHTGSETNPTITNGTNNVSGCVIIVFQNATGSWEIAGAGGGDNTAGTGFSVTAGRNPGITSGDMLVSFVALRSDAATPAGSGVTATSASKAAFTESPAPGLVAP